MYAPTGVNRAQGLIETNVIFDEHPTIKMASLETQDVDTVSTYEVMFGPEINFSIPYRVSPRVGPGRYPVSGRLEYQACDGEICLPPIVLHIALSIVKEESGTK